MRIIDADELMEMAEKTLYADHPFIRFMRSQVDKTPTIDAEPKWVLCEERLPEKEQLVLCKSRSGIINVLQLKPNGLWESQYPHVNYRFSFVTAWMPFPEPYKGRSK